MNEERMDAVAEEEWEDMIPAGPQDGEFEVDEGEVGADNTDAAQQESHDGLTPAQPEAAQREAEQADALPVPEVLKGEQGKEHPLLTRMREQTRAREMERFVALYPEVNAADIPRQVWQQTAAGVPLVTAYAMHENRQLKMQLAAERQDRLNRQRTPGGLGANSGGEPDELDRMWDEDD